jgi:hypothetical protein
MFGNKPLTGSAVPAATVAGTAPAGNTIPYVTDTLPQASVTLETDTAGMGDATLQTKPLVVLAE